MKLILNETSFNYSKRTEYNVKNSDLTLIFAKEVFSIGTIKIVNHCRLLEKPYFIFEFSNLNETLNKKHLQELKKLCTILIKFYKKGNNQIRINFAGNRLSIFKMEQKVINKIIFNIFSKALENLEKRNYPLSKLTLISGGQSGADISILNICSFYKMNCEINCPEDFMFENKEAIKEIGIKNYFNFINSVLNEEEENE